MWRRFPLTKHMEGGVLKFVLVCSSALMESLITPLQDKIEDWKKTANQLDKDHAKGK